MSKPETCNYHLFGKSYGVEKKNNVGYKKCGTSKMVEIVMVNLLTRSSLVELDADRKNQKFEKCFA